MSETTVTCYACGWHGTERIDQHQCSHVIRIAKLETENATLQARIEVAHESNREWRSIADIYLRFIDEVEMKSKYDLWVIGRDDD